jgi:hypothetical protein
MSTQLAASGVQLTAPAGWDSESFVDSLNGLAVTRVGSFQFQHDDTDDAGETARALMQGTDVLINIVDFTAVDPGSTNAAYVPTAAPLTIDQSTVGGQEGYPLSVAAVIRFAQVFGRNLHISVAFGSRQPSAAQLTAANAVLATLAPT